MKRKQDDNGLKKIRKGDFLISFFMAPGGVTVWLLEREGELFIQMLGQNGSWLCDHFPAAYLRDASHAVCVMLRMLGFTEFHVFETLQIDFHHPERNSAAVRCLLEQFKIYDDMKEAGSANDSKESQS